MTGLRVLIVEDEAMIAMMAEDMLEGAGCSVTVIAATLAEAAIAIEREDFDVAMLDVNLNGENSMGLAARLKARTRPFIFTTGYGSDGVAAQHADVPVVGKPYTATELHGALESCVACYPSAGTISTTSISDSNRG